MLPASAPSGQEEAVQEREGPLGRAWAFRSRRARSRITSATCGAPFQGFGKKWPALSLKQIAEPLGREAGVTDDSPHCVRVHGIVPWDGQNTDAVRHDNMLALPGNLETGLFECPDRAEMRDFLVSSAHATPALPLLSSSAPRPALSPSRGNRGWRPEYSPALPLRSRPATSSPEALDKRRCTPLPSASRLPDISYLSI
jgi:hypothetical protein